MEANQSPDSEQLLIDRLLSLVVQKRNNLVGYLIAILLICFALLVRFSIAPLSAGLQYLTFFPAVAVAAVLGGMGPGLLVVLIGLCFATFILTPPYWSISIFTFEKAIWSNIVFLTDGLIICFSIEAMHRYRENYERKLKKVQESEAVILGINKELDDFAYIASHDLKEPLRGIHNYASFLKEDFANQLDEDAWKYINSIQRLAERMTTLVDRLLEYSRIGSSEILKVTIDMDAIVDNVIEDLSALRAEGLVVTRIGKLGTEQGDAIRIGEIFQNLITNAAKYNDNPIKNVEIGRVATNTKVGTFYVKDNGIGIPPQHFESIFRIFKRLHEQSRYGGGSGAGLTIVRKIIEKHGGRIWLESTPEKGTTFYFTLRGEVQ